MGREGSGEEGIQILKHRFQAEKCQAKLHEQSSRYGELRYCGVLAGGAIYQVQLVSPSSPAHQLSAFLPGHGRSHRTAGFPNFWLSLGSLLIITQNLLWAKVPVNSVCKENWGDVVVLHVVLSYHPASYKRLERKVPSSSAQLFLPAAGCVPALLVALGFLLGIMIPIPGCSLDSGKLQFGELRRKILQRYCENPWKYGLQIQIKVVVGRVTWHLYGRDASTQIADRSLGEAIVLLND